jgi:diacylglycerol kinase family enzyme
VTSVDPGLLVAVLAVVLVGMAVVVMGVMGGLSPSRRRSPHPPDARSAREPDLGAPRPRAAVIVNPTKFDDVAPVRRVITTVCRQRGWADPLWLETTAQDPGAGQARQALAEGVDVICALGGDGTVRAVASAAASSGTPLGLLPAGTGNLLARNLELPIDSLEQCLIIALTGSDKKMDVGVLAVRGPGDAHGPPTEHMFVVMAGIGFDADIMSEAPERLKAKVGAAAYVVSGLRRLNGPQFAVDAVVDDRPTMHRRARTVIIGNCGKLQGGLQLLPDAELDDGWLDAVLLSPKGVFGWAAVLARVVTKTRHGHQRVDHHRCRRLRLQLNHPEEVQLDGDPIGPSIAVEASVRPECLTVRVP